MNTTVNAGPPSVLRLPLLLVALEPATDRRLLEAALVVLGLRTSLVERAVETGWLVRGAAGRLDLVDPRLARRLALEATPHERRKAHLALACVHGRGQPGSAGVGVDPRAVFDRASLALGDLRDAAIALVAPLTSQERTVAELAATGAATREIARAVVISPKTVEYHLTHVYRKLGIRSKAELAWALRPTLS